MLPRHYTATATLVIEPPGNNDPRSGTAVTAIYLESLKTYEEFAASDTLFAKACEKFHLTSGPGGPSVESLKSRVLRVNKLKDTKVLEISATLPDARQARAMVEYLAQETVALSRAVARDNDNELMTDLRKQVADAGAVLAKARAEEAAVLAAGTESLLESEVQILTDLKARASERLMEANATLAELGAREQNLAQQPSGNREDLESVRRDLASSRARVTALTRDRSGLEQETAAKSAILAGLRVRLRRVGDLRRTAETAFDIISHRANDLAATSGLRTEQLRIVDPGIVPQRPSSPNLLLLAVAAFGTSVALSLVYLVLTFGLARHRARAMREELRVTRGVR